MNNNTQASQQSRKGFWDVYEPNNHKRIYVTVFNSAEAESYAENGYKVVEQASQQVPAAMTDIGDMDFDSDSDFAAYLDAWRHAMPGEDAKQKADWLVKHVKGLMRNYAATLLAQSAPASTEDVQDGKRYRWLRDYHIGDEPSSINLDEAKGKRGLDAAIDAALSKGIAHE